jgi:ATP-binding cassette, subfamily B, bacterial
MWSTKKKITVIIPKVKDRIQTIAWAFILAWQIEKWTLVVWLGLSSVLAVLPAIALRYNREVISQISSFLATGVGSFTQVLPTIVILGVIITIAGLSARVNMDMISMVMYDTYYLGIQQMTMDGVQHIPMSELYKKAVNDEYMAIMYRPSSLTSFLSATCVLAGKMVSIISLLIVAFGSSRVIFYITIAYVIIMLVVNTVLLEKERWDKQKEREIEGKDYYYRQMPYMKGAAKEIRIFGNQNEALYQWEEAYKPIEKYRQKRTFTSTILSFAGGIGFYLFLFGMIVYLLFRVAAKSLGPDIFLMLYVLSLNIQSAIKEIPNGLDRADSGLFILEKQKAFFGKYGFKYAKKLPPSEEQDSVPKETRVVFEMQDVTFGYVPERPVLKDVNLRIYEGQTIALVGINGSGKTTLVKILLDLLKPNDGRVLFYGTDYKSQRADFLRQHVGVFFQDYFLFHTTLKENIGFGDIRHMNDERLISQALEKGGAGKLLKKMATGIHTLLGKDVDKEGTELSGGEKQRIAVSRSHMNNHEILIFDEPASMMDPIAEMEQFRNIQEKLKGNTALLISHRVGFARLTDRILVLDSGKIVEDGTHQELIAKNGLYADFFRQQAQWYDRDQI